MSLSNRQIFEKAVLILWGLYLWELLLTCDLELGLLTGKKRFKWPLVFYFLNRYCYFVAATLGIVLHNTNTKHCDAIFVTAILLGYFSHALAGVNLAIRLVAIWRQNVFIMGLLGVMILGYWVMVVIQGTQVSSSYVPNIGCVTNYDNLRVIKTILIYSICFDTIILGLSIYKLRRNFTGTRTESLTYVIIKQGVIFFVVALIVNLLTVIILSLHLKPPVIASIFMIVAMMTCTIVACRSVHSLYDILRDPQDAIVMMPVEGAIIGANKGQRCRPSFSFPSNSFSNKAKILPLGDVAIETSPSI